MAESSKSSRRNGTVKMPISRDDLVVETARLFGFDRTGPDLREAIDRQAEMLVKEGRLYLDENGLRLPDTIVAVDA